MSTPGQLVRSVFTLGASQMVSWVGAAALAVLLPRYLGDVNLGKLAFAIGFTTLFGLVADLGVATYLAKEVARDPSRAGSLTANALAMRVPLSLVAGVLAVAVVNLAGYEPLTRQLVYVLSVGIFLNALNTVTTGTLQGRQQMKLLAASSLLNKLGYAGLAAAMLLWGAGPVEVGVAFISGQLLGLAIGVLALRRELRPLPRIDWQVWRRILLGGMPFFVWQAALVVYGQIDAVLLSFLTHDAVVGWYAAAYRIVGLPMFAPTIIMMVIFPALSAAATDQRAYNAIARRAVQTVVVLSTPMVFGVILLPDKLMAFLDYPDSFANSMLPIMLLAPHILLVGADMIIGTILNTRDLQRQWALTAVAAAVLNPLLNLAAIPYAQAVFDNGAIGAAAVTTLTELFMLVVGLRLLPRGVFDRRTAVEVLKCLAAGLIMAGVVWLGRELPLVACVLLGALVYGVVSLSLGTISPGDLRQLQLHLARREPARVSA